MRLAPPLLHKQVHLLLRAAKEKTMGKPANIVLLFILLNLLYVSVLVNLFEVGDNNRFRFLVEPFYLVLLGLFLTEKFGGRSDVDKVLPE